MPDENGRPVAACEKGEGNVLPTLRILSFPPLSLDEQKPRLSLQHRHLPISAQVFLFLFREVGVVKIRVSVSFRRSSPSRLLSRTEKLRFENRTRGGNGLRYRHEKKHRKGFPAAARYGPLEWIIRFARRRQ